MSSCITCPPVQPCACSASQTCVTLLRSCDTCGSNECQDIEKGGKSSAGATAGQAIGGAAAGLLVAVLFYWFWWRKRHARRQAKQQHQRVPKSPTTAGSGKVHFGADTKGSAPAPRRSRFLSRQLGAEEKAELEHEINQEKQRQSLETAEARRSLPPGSRDPFADSSLDESSWLGGQDSSMMQARPNSMNSSDVSFRSSHSTTDIPIAYIPAHANSMSISDGNGLARSSSTRSQRTASNKRLIITKTDSDTTVPSSGSRSPKASTPLRPDRDPKLDLRLPKMPPTSSSGSFGVSSAPTSPAPTPESRFSTSTSGSHLSTDQTYLSLSPPPLPNRTISTISASSGHMSVMSHMSYILDPPQIVTQDSARVAVVGRAQGRAVMMPNTPNNSFNTEILRSDSGDMTRESILSTASSEDPFADEVSAVIGQFGTNGLGTPTFGGSSQSYFSADGTRAATPVSVRESSTSSMRDSAMSQPGDVTGEIDESLDFGSATPGVGQQKRTSDHSIFTSTSGANSRRGTMHSTVSSNHNSILDAVPFMAPPPSSASSIAPSTRPTASPTSPYFPLPPPRTGPPSRGASPLPPAVVNPFADSQAPETSFASNQATSGDDDELPMPVRPFAQNQQTRDSTSSAMSARSGYASVLEGIPFQLGLGGASQRGSLAYSENGDRASMAIATRPESHAAPPVPSLPTLPSQATLYKEESKEEVQQPKPLPPASQAESRASVDSFMQSAMLANQFADS